MPSERKASGSFRKSGADLAFLASRPRTPRAVRFLGGKTELLRRFRKRRIARSEGADCPEVAEGRRGGGGLREPWDRRRAEALSEKA